MGSEYIFASFFRSKGDRTKPRKAYSDYLCGKPGQFCYTMSIEIFNTNLTSIIVDSLKVKSEYSRIKLAQLVLAA